MKTCPNPNCTHAHHFDLEFSPDGDGQFTGGYHQWHVRCLCGMNGPNHETKEGAEELWDALPRDPEVEKKHKEQRAKFTAIVMSQRYKNKT